MAQIRNFNAGKKKSQTRTLENHKGAAPKFILARQGAPPVTQESFDYFLGHPGRA